MTAAVMTKQKTAELIYLDLSKASHNPRQLI